MSKPCTVLVERHEALRRPGHVRRPGVSLRDTPQPETAALPCAGELDI
jgi:hypothetical protein